MPIPIPSGGSPEGTGGPPVLPTRNAYADKAALACLEFDAWVVSIAAISLSPLADFS